MAIEFAERGSDSFPDTIPAHLLRAHARDARRTVAKSAKRCDPALGARPDRQELWMARLAGVTMVVAVVAGVLTAGLFAIAIPFARLPVAGLGLLAGIIAVRAGWTYARRRRRTG